MKKENLSTIFLVMILVIGLSMLLYPSFSDYWNSFHQTRAIATYTEYVQHLDENRYDQIWQDALDYNAKLASRETKFVLSEEELEVYHETLNVAGDDVMGYVDIPLIQCSLPIYHGVDEAVLQVGVGHLDWTSLPTGGANTHCVLSSHRGLTSAKLFTDLDKLREGDLFMLRVLDELFTYEVDQILIVEPQELNALTIQKGKDFCTLVTCTPYGVNSHRLLVRGHRVENTEETEIIRVTNDAVQVEPSIVAIVLAIPILLALLIYILIPKKKSKDSF